MIIDVVLVEPIEQVKVNELALRIDELVRELLLGSEQTYSVGIREWT